MIKLASALLLATALGACVTVNQKGGLVRQRASFDLACKQKKIEVILLGNEDVFGAEGCGRRATYIVVCNSGRIESCTAVLNSDGREVPRRKRKSKRQ